MPSVSVGLKPAVNGDQASNPLEPAGGAKTTQVLGKRTTEERGDGPQSASKVIKPAKFYLHDF